MSGAPGYPSTVGRVLTRSATRLPGRLALTFADRRYSYAQLDRATGRVAARLLERGLHPGDEHEAAAHKVPKSIHFVDELPKNASGKLLKRELRDRLSAAATGSTS